MLALRDFLRGAWLVSDAPALDGLCEAVDGRTISIRAASDQRDTGMRMASAALEWRLRPDLAKVFAEKVDALASSVAGHQYLDAYSSGVTVEVSTGECPESLHPDRP